jgi:predicted protein tyrosine phosphatase
MHWANEIVFVSVRNYNEARMTFHKELDKYKDKVIVLEIPDKYGFRDPKLVRIMKKQYVEAIAKREKGKNK